MVASAALCLLLVSSRQETMALAATALGWRRGEQLRDSTDQCFVGATNRLLPRCACRTRSV